MKRPIREFVRGLACTAEIVVTVMLSGALAVALLVPSSAQAESEPAITGARVSQNADRTRVVLDFSDRVTFRYFTLDDPCRIVLDLAQVDWQLPADGLNIENGVLKTLRYGLFRPGTSRVVLDCRAPLAIDEARFIAGHGGHGQRLVIDLIRVSQTAFTRAAGAPQQDRSTPTTTAPRTKVTAMNAATAIPSTKPTAAPPPTPATDSRRNGTPASKSDIIRAKLDTSAVDGAAVNGTVNGAHHPAHSGAGAVSVAVASTPRNGTHIIRPAPPTVAPTPVVFRTPLRKPRYVTTQRVIVIDPGHGGQDPGAISVSGVYEKKVTLRAARILRRELQRLGRYRVVMTRDSDVTVRLRDRIKIARDAGADLFLSVHADANPVSWVRGASVYTLSEKASDAEAAALAERENKADLISGVDLSVEEPEVATILIDLAQRETMNESARLASSLVQELGRRTVLLRNTHRFAGFAVLKAPDVPSVLVELGLLSNREDERLLQRRDYLTKMASAIAQATDSYFRGIKEARLR